MNFQSFARQLDILVNRYIALNSQPITVKVKKKNEIQEIKVYRSEMHFLDVVGSQTGINTTQLASTLAITKGAVTQNMNRLIKKELVFRKISDFKKNEIEIYLTDEGKQVFEEHRRYHREMLGQIEKCFNDMSPQEITHLESLLTAFNHYFTEKEKNNNVTSINKNT